MTANVRQLDVSEAKKFLDETRLNARTLLDVRQDFEYAEGHLPGSTWIPLPELSERLGELDRALPVLAYCHSGKRSLAAANLLVGQGFQDVMALQGGIAAWDGAQAVGPLDMGLKVLLAATTPDVLLERAWGMELALEGYYADLAGTADEAEVIALFERLAGFEERHCRTLVEIWKRRGGTDVDAFEERASASVDPETLEGGISAADYLGMLDDPANTAEALDLAMAIEAQALDLYLRRAKSETDPDLRRTLLLLSEEERAHLKLLGNFVSGRGRF